MHKYFRSQGGLIEDLEIADCAKASNLIIETDYGDGVFVIVGGDFMIFTPKRARTIAEFLIKCADRFESSNGAGDDNSGDPMEEEDEEVGP
jgi:hypothetical protein